MKANNSKIDEFISTTKTEFIIPVYQRNYDWKEPQCKQLLKDIIEVGKDDTLPAHFIGSIVYVHDDVYNSSAIKSLTIIDGQQRLTTLILLYLALYRFYQGLEDKNKQDEIKDTYLINKYKESLSEDEKLKLIPTDNNNMALKYIFNGGDPKSYKEPSNIIENFNYFIDNISDENYKYIEKVIRKLIFIDVSLERGKDDPQRIFESLNSTGLALSKADLIRNYILVGLDKEKQHEVYDKWKVIEEMAYDKQQNNRLVSEFIRHYLTIKNNNIPAKDRIYEIFKKYYEEKNEEEKDSVLDELLTYSYYYQNIINPEEEKDESIRQELKYIKQLEVNVSHPFLLTVYDDFHNKIIDKKTFIEILSLVQSFVWRRFILGLPTNALNKIFMNLCSVKNKDNYLYSIQEFLLKRKGSAYFPNNKDIKKSLKEKDIYNINKRNTNYLLERLENYNNKEKVFRENNKTIQIEHIFPQNPDESWNEIGDDYKIIYENYLHTLANITLTAYNQVLSNNSFLEKRLKGYNESRLWLNKYLSEIDVWNLETLEKRFDLLYKRFLEIWQYPDIKLDYLQNKTYDEINDEVNIFDAHSPTGKKIEYAIFQGEKLEITQHAKSLYQEIFKKLFSLYRDLFFESNFSDKIELTQIPGSLRVPIQIDEKYFIEGNLSNDNKFERIKLALEICDTKDDLFIKYLDE